MSDKNNINLESISSDEYKILAKNSFFSFLNSYGTYLFQIAIYFFIARLISKEIWDFLIIANSIILIVILIGTFFPPGLENSLNYFIPKYYALNQRGMLKHHMKYAIYSQAFFIIPLFLISLFFFIIFSNLFSITLSDHTNLLFIYCPIIIFTSIDRIMISIEQGLNMFNTIFFLIVIRYSFNIIALILCFIFINPIQVEYIALINLFAIGLTFFINCVIFLLKFRSFNYSGNVDYSLKSFFKETIRYGLNLRIGNFFSDVWAEFQTIAIALFATAGMVTGFNISRNYAVISSSMTITFLSPLTITFSRLFVKKGYEQIKTIYNIYLIYSLFSLLLLTGILYFCVDFFLYIIYGSSYLIYSPILTITLFTIIFLGIGSPFESLMRSTDNSKWILRYRLIAFSVRLPIFLLFLIYFGLFWAIFSLIFVHLVIAICALILGVKIGKITINQKKLLSIFLSFALALGATLFFEFLFLNQINILVLQAINLLNFNYINLFSLLVFILLFLIFIYLLGIFSTRDLDYLESIIKKDTKIRVLLTKTLNFLKKFAKN